MFFTIEKRPVEVTLRIAASDLPEGSQVGVTDIQLQKGAEPTGIVPNPREAGTTADVRRWANGAVNGEMVVVALSNALRATPARVQVEGVYGEDVKMGDMRFGRVDGTAWASAETTDASQGWGRPPTITERSDLRLTGKVGQTQNDMGEEMPGARAHLRLAWTERT